MKESDPIKPWFAAAEETGEYIGIRFGHIAPGKTEPDWFYLPHSEVDGIGGFADLLRRRGAEICRLPQIKHPAARSRLAVLKNAPKFLLPRRKLKWIPFEDTTRICTNAEPPAAVAWHVFDENTTTQIRRVCRKSSVTVNSFLLKHLTKAIRQFLEDQSASIPWMIPINLRGKITRGSDIANHSSYVSVKVRSYDTIRDIHRRIYAALAHGDHWANWYAYDSSRILTAGMLRYLIKIEKCMAEWHIGAFSNLGDWDAEKKLTATGCKGDWLFAPPVLRCQHIGAGCVTFQNRLTLLIQAHPELTTCSEVPQAWMESWVKEIQMDLASLLPETA
ncbi:MAG: hypothetical protein H0X66_16730 [Verrucomicrobia bacterium]|nr:hypothetical protein [Verrucomicrobiota bacterium]